MASVLYRLLSAGFSTLDANAWLHALVQGEIRLTDPNETGPKGSLLHQVLAAGRPQRYGWSAEKDDHRFLAEPSHERLVLWLIEQGADPWVRNTKGLNAWSEAIWRGWPNVLKALVAHPAAPAAAQLESERLPWDGIEDTSVRADLHWTGPALFADRNQIEAMQAWRDAGLNVNLGVGKGQSAGRRARTPECLEAWALLGGAIDQDDVPGTPLPKAWSFSSASQRVAMERVWLKHQKRPPQSVDDRMAALLEECAHAPKTLFVHRLKSYSLTLTTADSQGRTFLDHWLPVFLKNPRRFEASVAEFLLAQASTEQVWETQRAGLLQLAPADRSKIYPTESQLLAYWRKVGPVQAHNAIAAMATQVAENPAALTRLLCLSLRFGDDSPEETSLSKVDETLVLYRTPNRLARIWEPWLRDAVNPATGARMGWKAFAAWAAKSASSSDGGLLEGFWKAIARNADPDLLQSAAPLLGLADILSRWPDSGPNGFLERWAPDPRSPWTSRLSNLAAAPSYSDADAEALALLESAVDLRVGNGPDRPGWEALRARLREQTLENRLADPPSVRPRLRM